ncbi:ABC transporter permease [Pengzhenrongella sp.]|jgi:peptide/nickel transport system permease protein|uniref:ABC transporter permease n=1 Tax=Pengzhenrongella sp. TaxID=2888820 RepID=UPI002F94E55C
MALSLLKNLARSVGVILSVTFATFAMMYSNGSGVARSVLGLNATATDIQREVAELGLDRPLLTQYWEWLSGAATGDLGTSFYTGQTVRDALSNRVPVTVTIVIITLLLTTVISVILGVTAAVRGGWVDRLVQFFTVLGAAVPGYVVAIVLVFTFAVAWRLLPATGYVPIEQGLSPWAASVTLPVVSLLVGTSAGVAAMFRAAVLDTLGRDYVRTLRARGVKEREVIFRNVLRNAAVPGLTALNLTMVGLFAGAVFIEIVFALPGVGQLGQSAALSSDVPMVMGTVLVTLLIVLTVNFLSDLGVTLLNPKARHR